MLTANQLRQVAARSGARDIANVEIDVILTYLLQLFHEQGLLEHLAFKGGTMLRKTVFGPRGRLSTDLDFTRRTNISLDDLMMAILEALDQPYHGLGFRLDRDKDWYFTDDGCAANPICSHADNARGVKIKLQVSAREEPILPVVSRPQLQQDYFHLLPFAPASIPCLALDEVVAEKIRAASQRSKIRDLHDLSELAKRPLNREQIRAMAVLKRIEGGADYDIADLRNLLRKAESPDLTAMTRRTVESFQFLEAMTGLERVVAADNAMQAREAADELMSLITSRAVAAPADGLDKARGHR